MRSVEYQSSTMALVPILVARGGSEGTTGPNLEEELKAILGSSWQQLQTGHVCSCYSVMIQEEDRSVQSSREVASSDVSAAAPAGSPGTSVAMAVAANDNKAIATTSADNKRRRLHFPQRQ
ncbi:hypothetical protein CFC21_099921 [Triticum aestivum]|uniref:Uncharacterized protein n=2 Tax=Triticum aestivum TaxID=4565 RepID=A0A3B6RQV2_WHEAT|nr:cyclin-D5-3-like [Triticum aestivum]KAF7098159.1 hypothetical protein CFC21_099921 [Triticum aestivum]